MDDEIGEKEEGVVNEGIGIENKDFKNEWKARKTQTI